MAGQPEVREAGWLHAPGDEVPLVHVRLEQAPGGGWTLYLADPAAGPSERAEYPDEASARAALDAVYEAGQADGEWRINRR